MYNLYSEVLNKTDILSLNNVILGDNFPWYYSPATVVSKDNNFMFTHIFVKEQKVNSDFYWLLEPLLNFINLKKPYDKIERIKANLYTNQGKNIKQKSHYDYIENDKNCFIALFNLITCDGGTVIESDNITSNANQLIIFNNVKHYGITQKDSPVRVAINFNFMKTEEKK
tara:strand:+ start:102 stop:611 length:510 start_codon:yes stop_codon:yes gene_type:complete